MSTGFWFALILGVVVGLALGEFVRWLRARGGRPVA
jgi:hypothetical protein